MPTYIRCPRCGSFTFNKRNSVCESETCRGRAGVTSAGSPDSAQGGKNKLFEAANEVFFPSGKTLPSKTGDTALGGTVFRNVHCPLCETKLPTIEAGPGYFGGGDVNCAGCRQRVSYWWSQGNSNVLHVKMLTVPIGRSDPGERIFRV